MPLYAMSKEDPDRCPRPLDMMGAQDQVYAQALRLLLDQCFALVFRILLFLDVCDFLLW